MMDDEQPTSSAWRDQCMDAWTDLDLVRAMVDGNELALRAFYERHARWLAVRLRRTLPRDAVEDVLQETFLAVWNGAARFSGDGEPAAWLWGISRRQAALWLRRAGKHALELDERALTSRLGGHDPARDALANLDLQQAFAASGQVGSDGRDLAQRVFVRDQSFAEISSDLDIPVGTVKSRVFALRRRMKQALGRDEA